MGNISMQERILDAALEVVAKYTINGTRMHLIAKEAELLTSNIQYYFRTKEALLLALNQKILSEFAEERKIMREQAPASFLDKLKIFFTQKKNIILNKRKQDNTHFDFWIQGLKHKTIGDYFYQSQDGWRKAIADTIAEYLPESDPQMRKYISLIMLSMMQGASLQYNIREGFFDLDVYFELCFKMVLAVLETQPSCTPSKTIPTDA
ncbi:MAG: TetR/AcrR family transcriptional regulator [Bacillota bacterium]